MTAIVQTTMRRARFDTDNAEFFEHVESAQLLDFIPQISLRLAFTAFGITAWFFNLSALILFGAGVSTLMFLRWQFFDTTRFWNAARAQG